MSVTPTPTTEQVIAELLRLPMQIESDEHGVLQAQQRVIACKSALADREGALLTAATPEGKPVIDGKNEAIRQAQLAEHTINLRDDLKDAEAELATARIHLSRSQSDFSAYRAVAGLLRTA